MKKFFSIFILAALVFTGCDSITTEQQNKQLIQESQVKNTSNALTAYPTPTVTNFLERKTVSEWVKRWDKPSILTYCYIFVGQNCIGYFITNGKPASANSFLIPEDQYEWHSNGGGVIRQASDLDGTYGSNNAGYRFFLANGTAVECSGTMISCVYADAPLSIDVPQITSITN